MHLAKNRGNYTSIAPRVNPDRGKFTAYNKRTADQKNYGKKKPPTEGRLFHFQSLEI